MSDNLPEEKLLSLENELDGLKRQVNQCLSNGWNAADEILAMVAKHYEIEAHKLGVST